MADEFFADRLFNALERNDPAPGMLLVAAPGIDSLDYSRSVVLIIHHGEDGTFGVDLTRRTDLAVENHLADYSDLVAKPKAFYLGGPAHDNAIVALGVTRPGADISSRTDLGKLATRMVAIDLNAGIAAASASETGENPQPEELREVIEGARFFVGASMWEPGQLFDEIEHGDWFVAPALPGDLVAAGAADLWADVLRRQHLPLPLVATFPSDLEDN